jgi:hypothetical protein
MKKYPKKGLTSERLYVIIRMSLNRDENEKRRDVND